MPGDTLIVHLDNALTGLTIKDFYDPSYTPKGEAVPIYPRQMGSSPFNLHTMACISAREATPIT